ncbi:MAG: type VI secretion system-associated FHA domain protein TagH [Aquisalimonadaceae bacterium]
MPLTLTVINDASSRLGADASRVWHERSATIGRADNSDWQLPDPNKEISRCHARVRYRQGAYFLEDTSANGIMLADGVTRLDPAEPHALDDGDEFVIGDYRIRVSIAAEQPPAPTPEAQAPDLPQDGDATDPLELLGGKVEAPPVPLPGQAQSQSYLNEHFSAPPVSTPPAAPDQPPKAPPASSATGGLLPDDWWKSSTPEPPAARDPAAEAPPAVEPPAETVNPPPVAPRPMPGGRGGAEGAGAAEPPAGVPAAASPGVPDQALRQLLAGAGLDPDQVPADKAEELGRILRVAVHGVMDLLRARMEIKNEFRMSVTLIQARENNPLKFSTSTEDAIHNLMVKHNPDYLAPVEAFEASFEDLRFHQLALLSGMRTAFFEMLRQFDPETLEERFGRGGERSMLDRVTGPRHWDQYKSLFEDINRDTEGYFNRLFGEAFVEAYEKQMQALKSGAGKVPGRKKGG